MSRSHPFRKQHLHLSIGKGTSSAPHSGLHSEAKERLGVTPDRRRPGRAGGHVGALLRP